MFNLLNIANSDNTFEGEGVIANIDNAKSSAFSFNSLLSLGNESQSNNIDTSIFDGFLNSNDVSTTDLKLLSQIIDKNPIVSLKLKSELITKLDKLKIDFIDDELIDSIKNKLNTIKPIIYKDDSKTLSDEFKEKILFMPNSDVSTKQNITNNYLEKSSKDNVKITINSIQDVEKISNKYDLNISKLKIETFDNKSINKQIQTAIDAPEVLNTSDIILFKKIKNKKVDIPNNAIKDIFTNFNKQNKNNEIKILPTATKIYPIKEVEKINHLAFSHNANIEDFKNNKSFEDIKSLNNLDFKSDVKNISDISDNKINIQKSNIPSNIKTNAIINDTKIVISDTKTVINSTQEAINGTKAVINDNVVYDSSTKYKASELTKDNKKYSLKDVLETIPKKETPIQTKEVHKTTVSFYKHEPIETINVNTEKQTTLKDIFDLKDKITTNEKHILDNSNKETIKHTITSREANKKVVQKPQSVQSIFSIIPKNQSSNLVDAKIDDKKNNTKLLNSLMSNSINRMAITNEVEDNRKIKTLIQELSQTSKEQLDNQKTIDNQSIKIQIEPLALNEKDLSKNIEPIQNTESLVEQESNTKENTTIDVSKFKETNQSKELNQIMQRQIINGVYENLRYKLKNFVAPLMKFAMELKPASLGKIEVDIMVRGNNLQVNIKSSKKVSSLLESESGDLKNEFSVLGYKNITIDFDESGGESADSKDGKPKDNNDFNTQRDTKWL